MACAMTRSEARAAALDASELPGVTCSTTLEDCGFLSEGSRRSYGRRVQRLVRERHGCKVKLSDLPLEGTTPLCDVGDQAHATAT